MEALRQFDFKLEFYNSVDKILLIGTHKETKEQITFEFKISDGDGYDWTDSFKFNGECFDINFEQAINYTNKRKANASIYLNYEDNTTNYSNFISIGSEKCVFKNTFSALKRFK